MSELCLFGSWARGEATEDSDVDVHFVVPGRLEPAHQQTFARLETWRDKADYQEGFTGDRSLLDREIAACEALRDRLLALLAASGYSGA